MLKNKKSWLLIFSLVGVVAINFFLVGAPNLPLKNNPGFEIERIETKAKEGKSIPLNYSKKDIVAQLYYNVSKENYDLITNRGFPDDVAPVLVSNEKAIDGKLIPTNKLVFKDISNNEYLTIENNNDQLNSIQNTSSENSEFEIKEDPQSANKSLIEFKLNEKSKNLIVVALKTGDSDLGNSITDTVSTNNSNVARVAQQGTNPAPTATPILSPIIHLYAVNTNAAASALISPTPSPMVTSTPITTSTSVTSTTIITAPRAISSTIVTPTSVTITTIRTTPTTRPTTSTTIVTPTSVTTTIRKNHCDSYNLICSPSGNTSKVCSNDEECWKYTCYDYNPGGDNSKAYTCGKKVWIDSIDRGDDCGNSKFSDNAKCGKYACGTDEHSGTLTCSRVPLTANGDNCDRNGLPDVTKCGGKWGCNNYFNQPTYTCSRVPLTSPVPACTDINGLPDPSKCGKYGCNSEFTCGRVAQTSPARPCVDGDGHPDDDMCGKYGCVVQGLNPENPSDGFSCRWVAKTSPASPCLDEDGYPSDAKCGRFACGDSDFRCSRRVALSSTLPDCTTTLDGYDPIYFPDRPHRVVQVTDQSKCGKTVCEVLNRSGRCVRVGPSVNGKKCDGSVGDVCGFKGICDKKAMACMQGSRSDGFGCDLYTDCRPQTTTKVTK